jgi:glycosyltransferase involved in cell wall biosynthesis
MGAQLLEIRRQVPPSDEEHLLYSHQPEVTQAWIGGAPFVHRGLPGGGSVLRRLAGFALAQRRDRLDVFHADFTLPLLNACPTVVTVHDALIHSHPRFFPRSWAYYYGPLLRLSVRRATLIVTDCEYTKGEISDRYSIDRERVRVVPCGVDQSFFTRVDDSARKRELVERYRLPERFVVHVGRIDPRKNLPGLIRAMALYRRRRKSEVAVVLVGPAWTAEAMKAVLQAVEESQMQGATHLLGAVPSEDLPTLYSLASAMAFPSFAEGFGLPVLEAMSCGTPVVCSDATCLPEVSGDAALSFAPDDLEQLASCLETALEDSARRADLVRKGYERAALFTWERSVRLLRQAYREVAEGKLDDRSRAPV